MNRLNIRVDQVFAEQYANVSQVRIFLSEQFATGRNLLLQLSAFTPSMAIDDRNRASRDGFTASSDRKILTWRGLQEATHA